MVLTSGEFVLDMRNDPMDELALLQRHWLTITGLNGVGKTMVARRVWRWYQEHGRVLREWAMERAGHFCKMRSGRFVDWRRMVTRLREGTGFSEFDDLRDVWLLILDEIGMEQDKSGFATDKLAELLSGRLHKWTMMTSNVSVMEWAEIDARIGSRMTRDGSKVIEVKCRDYATRKLQKEIADAR
jgi:DNA replication protein DnaC